MRHSDTVVMASCCEPRNRAVMVNLPTRGNSRNRNIYNPTLLGVRCLRCRSRSYCREFNQHSFTQIS